ncbi:BrnT family toxin [soil metagenome]
MDKIFELQGIEFEWNEEKYAVNLRKHSVRFEEAAEVFFDPENQFGDASVDDEFREYVIGYSLSSRILLVVFVERSMRTRIISARQATSQERKEYEER